MSTGTLTLSPAAETALVVNQQNSPEELAKIEEARQRLIVQAQAELIGRPGTVVKSTILQLRPPTEGIAPTPPTPDTIEPLRPYSLKGFRGQTDNFRRDTIFYVTVDGKAVDVSPQSLENAGLTAAKQPNDWALSVGTATSGGTATVPIEKMAQVLGITVKQAEALVVPISKPEPIPPGAVYAQVTKDGKVVGHILLKERPPEKIDGNPGDPGKPGTPGKDVTVAVTASREQTALGHAPRAHLNAVPGGGVTGAAGVEFNSGAFGGVAQVTASTNVLNNKVELLAGGTYLLSNGKTAKDVEGTGQLVGQAGYLVTDGFKVVGGAFQLIDAQIGGTTTSIATTVDGEPIGENLSTTIIADGNPGGLYAGVNARFQLGTNTEIKTQATVNQTLWGNDPYGTPTPTLRGDVQLQQHFGDFSLAAAAGTSYRTGALPEGATRANYNLSLAASVALGPKPGGWESAIVGGEAPGQTGQVVVTPELTATTMNHKQDGPNPDVAWLTAYQVQVTEKVTQEPNGTFSGAWVVQFQPNDIPGASAQALQIGPVSGKSREEIDEMRATIEAAADGFNPNLQRSGVTRKLIADDAAVAAQLLSTFQEKLPGVPLAPIDATAVPTGDEISSSLVAAEAASTTAEVDAQRAQQLAVIQQATDVLAADVTRPLTPTELEQRRAAIAALTPGGIHRVVIGTDGELLASQAGVPVDPQNIIPAADPLHSKGVVGNDPVPDGALDLVVMGEDGIPVAPVRPGSLPGQVQAASPVVGQPGKAREENRLTLQQAGVIR
jgi:hypothetical protein